MGNIHQPDAGFSLEEAVQTYTQMLFRIAFSMTGDPDDAEDILQNVFLKYHLKHPAFSDSEHCKAWLIRTAVNETKDFLRFRKRQRTLSENAALVLPREQDRTVMEALLALPVKLQSVMYLFYVEGYRAEEIGKMLGTSSAAVRKRLQKGREALKSIYLEGEV